MDQTAKWHIVRMILDNPFHVLGLVANCGARQKSRREAQIKRYLEVRKPLVFTDDLYFPGCRRNEMTVARAQASLHDTRDRIGAGLFWFTDGNALDKHALQSLAQGNMRDALQAWRRIESKSPTLNYASSLNNLGTICLLLALIGEPRDGRGHSRGSDRAECLNRGLTAKANLVGGLTGSDLTAFCATFSDGMASHDPKEVAKIFAVSLEDFKGEADRFGLDLPTQSLVAPLDQGGARTAGLKPRFASRHREELEGAIRACEAAYEHNPAIAAEAGNRLMAVARCHLPELAAVVSDASYVYAKLADDVTEELLDTAVCNFNYHSKVGPVSMAVARSSSTLARYALSIACGAAARTRARENVEAIEKVEAELRRQEAMDGVHRPMQAWLQRANDMLELSTSPERRIDFVRHAIVKSGASGDSAIELMERVRQRGMEVSGSGFRSSEEMIQLGSAVCRMCVSLLASAYNESEQPATEMAAAELLGSVADHFEARPGRSDWPSAVFLVDDECYAHLRQNWSASVEYLSAARATITRGVVDALLAGQARKAQQDRWRSGCVAVVIVAAFAAFALMSQDAPATSDGELEFRQPPVGVNRVLSLPELRWCVRQEEAVDASERRLAGLRGSMSQDAVARHNAMVGDYNARCGEFRYRDGHLERAKREVRGASE